MHRPSIGIIAIILLAVGAYTQYQENDTVAAACFRVGAVMTILWFAEPQMRGVPRWGWIAGGAGLLLLTRWPKLMVVALPVAAALWVLRPRGRV